MCRGEVRLKADRLFELAARLIELAALQVDASQSIVRLSRTGIGMERGEQLPLGLVPIPGHGSQDAQIVVRCIVRGINGQEMLQPRTRLWVVFLLKIDMDQQFFGARVPRLKRQRRLKFFDGVVRTLQPKETQGKIEVRLSVPWSLI